MTKPDRLLGNAGGLLLAVAAAVATVGGIHGLGEQRPGIVIFSVLLLMGYGVVGYLLMNRGKAYFPYVLPATGALALVTILLLNELSFDARKWGDFPRYVLYPAVTTMLCFAAGALLTHALEEATPRVKWPAKGTPTISTLLHIAAIAAILDAHALLDWAGPTSPLLRVTILAASVVVAIACVVGGYAASRGSHPRYAVVGAALGFAAFAYHLFQFMVGGGDRDVAALGQFVALVGLIVSGLPAALGSVAWIQTTAGDGLQNEVAPPAQGE